jgi:hypothetical protein
MLRLRQEILRFRRTAQVNAFILKTQLGAAKPTILHLSELVAEILTDWHLAESCKPTGDLGTLSTTGRIGLLYE